MPTIRPATPADFATIQQIAHNTWPHTCKDILSKEQIPYMLNWMYSFHALQEQVMQKGHQFLLAEEGGDAVGFTGYELNYKGRPETKIHKIYMLPAAQGKGIGKALMDAVAAIARSNGNSTLTLNVNRYNKAVTFYQRYGFTISGQVDIDIGNNYLMEDYIMQYHL
ncbi:MAG: GNAT family N-acetyltransferase [Hymenobacteraceae bacterium]|nr:GNAT family N-acetyltransferase [Hymenobacteraceae bacterium]MDX5395897.1 GNAT family N-acetyltransferase [Hymenobacteraceae bacterium]MDX5511952.1 GNAT family N-acetyltransferase [Hymenobacteraceae bacterium]